LLNASSKTFKEGEEKKVKWANRYTIIKGIRGGEKERGGKSWDGKKRKVVRLISTTGKRYAQ